LLVVAFVVFAGQSNAVGNGMTAETLPVDAFTPDPLTYIWNDAEGWFEMLRPAVNTGTANRPEAWGPEVGYAAAFRREHPDEILIIVKSAKGSTGLAADEDALDWSPDSEGELFDQTAGIVARARAYIGGAEVDAVFFTQGEQDAVLEETAAAYQHNLTTWLEAVRDQWMGDPEGRIGFSLLAGGTPYADEVREGQLLADEADPLADSFATRDLPAQADGLHFAPEAYLEIGARFLGLYDAWI
jgi:hypothetical protein